MTLQVGEIKKYLEHEVVGNALHSIDIVLIPPTSTVLVVSLCLEI